MITGIETAGLVLAVLPLLITGLEDYQKGLVPMKDWLRYRSVVKSLIRSLKMEQIRLRDTCEKLLSNIVPDEEIADLIASPGGPDWCNDHIEETLKDRLRESFVVYMDTIEDMKDLLSKLKVKLGLDYEDKVFVHSRQFPRYSLGR